MADVKISQLPVATTPVDGTEVLPIVQSATTKQVSIANLTAGRAMAASSLTLTTPLAVTSGGTGIATAAQGSLLSATGADTFSATRTPTLGLAGTAAGTLGLSGSSSGVVTLATAATTNNWTFTLPTNAGTNNFILTTNGSGVTTWTNPTALGVDLDVGTTAITGGTTGRVLYNNAGVLGEYSAVPTSVGGTGLSGASPFVSSGLLYASSASALTTSANLSYSSDILLVGGVGNPQIKVTSSTSGSSGGFVVDGTGATSFPSYNISQSNVNLWSMQLRGDTNLHFYRQSGSGNVIFDNSAVGFSKAPLFTVDIAGTFGLSTNLASTLPTASSGLVIGQNFSGGQAEIDFFHNDSAYVGGNGGFRFYQRTGASTSNVMLLMNQNTFTAYTTNTSRLTIDSSGQIGIGTGSASGYILDVNSGAARFGGGFTYIGAYNSGGTNFPLGQAAGAVSWNQSGGAQETDFWNCATGASRSFQFYQLTTSGSAATLLFRIDYNPSGVYGTTVGATNRALYIDNGMLIGGLTSVRAAKMNIASINDIDWVNNLNPVTFNFRLKDEDGNYTDTPDGPKQYGLIADEMEAINRDLCIYDMVDGEEKLVGIHYDRLVTPLIKYAQTLAARIAILEARK